MRHGAAALRTIQRRAHRVDLIANGQCLALDVLQLVQG